MEKVGKEGVITVEEGKTAETTLEVVEGMQFDRGYLSRIFVTHRHAGLSSRMLYLLISEKEDSSNMKDLLPLLEAIARQLPLVIIAEAREALATLVVNKLLSRHAPLRRREGAWASGIAARRCCRTSPCSRVAGHQRGPRPQARERHPREPRPRQAHHHGQGRHDDSLDAAGPSNTD